MKKTNFTFALKYKETFSQSNILKIIKRIEEGEGE